MRTQLKKKKKNHNKTPSLPPGCEAEGDLNTKAGLAGQGRPPRTGAPAPRRRKAAPWPPRRPERLKDGAERPGAVPVPSPAPERLQRGAAAAPGLFWARSGAAHGARRRRRPVRAPRHSPARRPPCSGGRPGAGSDPSFPGGSWGPPPVPHGRGSQPPPRRGPAAEHPRPGAPRPPQSPPLLAPQPQTGERHVSIYKVYI